jgi:hypothetical protein
LYRSLDIDNCSRKEIVAILQSRDIEITLLIRKHMQIGVTKETCGFHTFWGTGGKVKGNHISVSLLPFLPGP